MMNLLEETIRIIEESKQSIETIVYIGDHKGNYCSWSEFKAMADKEYDNGYGGSEVLDELKIVFTDGSWLERGEYDGAEWWEYKTTPSKEFKNKLTSVFNRG